MNLPEQYHKNELPRRLHHGYSVCDFHAHVYPDAIAPRVIQTLEQSTGHPCRGIGTVDHLLERSRDAGVSNLVLSSVATTARQASAINSFLAASAAGREGCFALGTLHPDMSDEELDTEIRRIRKLGLKGVKLHPDSQGVHADDPKMLRVFERLEGKLPVLVHCGDYRNDYSHPSRIANVLDAFPNLTMVAAHLGGWTIVDYALEYLENKHCYLDVSSVMMFIGPRRERELIRLYGAERILYGTDYPIWDPVESLDAFLNLGLTEEENRQILYRNAQRVLFGGS